MYEAEIGRIITQVINSDKRTSGGSEPQRRVRKSSIIQESTFSQQQQNADDYCTCDTKEKKKYKIPGHMYILPVKHNDEYWKERNKFEEAMKDTSTSFRHANNETASYITPVCSVHCAGYKGHDLNRDRNTSTSTLKCKLCGARMGISSCHDAISSGKDILCCSCIDEINQIVEQHSSHGGSIATCDSTRSAPYKIVIIKAPSMNSMEYGTEQCSAQCNKSYSMSSSSMISPSSQSSQSPTLQQSSSFSSPPPQRPLSLSTLQSEMAETCPLQKYCCNKTKMCKSAEKPDVDYINDVLQQILCLFATKSPNNLKSNCFASSNINTNKKNSRTFTTNVECKATSTTHLPLPKTYSRIVAGGKRRLRRTKRRTKNCKESKSKLYFCRSCGFVTQAPSIINSEEIRPLSRSETVVSEGSPLTKQRQFVYTPASCVTAKTLPTAASTIGKSLVSPHTLPVFGKRYTFGQRAVTPPSTSAFNMPIGHRYVAGNEKLANEVVYTLPASPQKTATPKQKQLSQTPIDIDDKSVRYVISKNKNENKTYIKKVYPSEINKLSRTHVDFNDSIVQIGASNRYLQVKSSPAKPKIFNRYIRSKSKID